ncbi:MAG: hypothetical protein ACR2KU_08040 [Gammaproteobacteria bacterium]
MTRIGIVAALDGEARTLIRRSLKPPMEVNVAQACDVRVALASMGASRARAAGEQLLAQGATALMSWGVAAALDRALAPGNLLVPGVILDTDLRSYSVDTAWHGWLCEQLKNRFVIHVDPLIESTTVLATRAQKRALMLRSGAMAADMESAALAALASEAQVPFVAIRAVSDTAVARVPTWLGGVIDNGGHVCIGAVIRQVLARPLDWAAVSRLALGFRAARATLTDVASLADGRFFAT